ncbi:MAG: sigma 54-interacting transcriptional regulator, partial [Bacteroidales bacterium]|nr:sigma 54-interacting transcriptional regulator [Bacteroidales bacterium]
IFATTDDAVLIVNNFGIITAANTVSCRIFQSICKELVGTQLKEIIEKQFFLKSELETGKPILNKDIYIQNTKYLCSIYPIINYARKNEGYMLTLRQINHHSNYYNSASGSTAKYTFDNIIGSSVKSKELMKLAKKFARFNSNILIQGESGTGKEVYAQAIHNESRPNGSFIAVNCAAIPRNLIESELFGYEAGAFTGAERRGKPGKIELANGGTLFLDEIGDMPVEVQAVLLRVLEDKMVMRVGGSRYIPVDFRLITATNKDLLDLVQKNQFREDLFYRISVFRMVIPPLRERGSDVIQLAEYFINLYAQAQHLPAPILSNAAKYCLFHYNWPGNVRQLQNAICYASCMSSEGVILPEDLPEEILNFCSSVDFKEKQIQFESSSVNKVLSDSLLLRDLEISAIKKALNAADNSICEAAKLLGLSKSTLYRRIKYYNIIK